MSRLVLVIVSLGVLMLSFAVAKATNDSPVIAKSESVKQPQQTEHIQAPKPARQTITLHAGYSQVVLAPWPISRVSVTNPNVADVRGLTADQVLLMGKTVGTTDLLLWNDREEHVQQRVQVVPDLDNVRGELGRYFPGSTLQVNQSGEVVVLTGQLARAEHARQLHQLLEGMGVRYIDMTSVAGVQQVQIQVRVAEVSRTAIRTLGVNAFFTGNDFFGGVTIGPDNGGAINPINIGVPAGAPAQHGVPFQFTQDVNVASSVTLFGGFPSADFQVFLQALAENQYLRILAEPNLVALSGEQASFLVGGEFPIPVVQSGAVGGSTAISIEYKEFGIRLLFSPTVLGDGRIRLYVAPEVSDLTDIGAVVIQGFRVPALSTRRAETTLELKSGQTFGMAGLINRTANARNSRVPGLGDIPVLGTLFRSVRYAEGETELVVLVTATLVEPMSLDRPPPLPGGNHVAPNDWQLYCLGELEGQPAARVSDAQAEWLHRSGLHRLKGPGAWQRYDSDPAPIRGEPSAPAVGPSNYQSDVPAAEPHEMPSLQESAPQPTEAHI